MNIVSTESVPKCQEGFTALLPQIEDQLTFAFRYLPLDAREEAIQECVVHCLIGYRSLAKRNRIELAYPSALVKFSVKRYRAGRRVAARNARCRRSCPPRFESRATGLGRYQSDPDGRLTILELVEDRRTPVPDRAAFRIDVPHWLAGLAHRTREIAQDLAAGWSTGELAEKHKVTCARISQIRRRLYESWYQYHDLPIPSTGVS